MESNHTPTQETNMDAELKKHLAEQRRKQHDGTQYTLGFMSGCLGQLKDKLDCMHDYDNIFDILHDRLDELQKLYVKACGSHQAMKALDALMAQG